MLIIAENNDPILEITNLSSSSVGGFSNLCVFATKRQNPIPNFFTNQR